VEVGAAPLDPIELALAAAPAISGSISIEGDTPKTPRNNMQVMMNAIEVRAMMGPQPQTGVQSDGTFILNSVMPGRWRLFVNGAPGYVKSVMQGDQEVPPWDLEIGSSTAQLKIVVGTKYTRVEAELSAPASGSEPISAILWPANGDPTFQQNLGMISQTPSTREK